MQFQDPKKEPEQTQSISNAIPSVFTDPILLGLTVLSKWWIILIAVLITVTAGLVHLNYATAKYRGKARVEIIMETRASTRNLSQYDKQERRIQRHALILSSNKLHNEVKSNLSEKWGSKLTDEERSVSFKWDSIRESRDSMLDLIVDSVDPLYAEDYLNEMITVYRVQRAEELEEVNLYATSGLQHEEERMRLELAAGEQELREFENGNNVTLARERERADAQMLNQLVAQLKSLKMKRTVLESQFGDMVDQDSLTIREALSLTRDTVSYGKSNSQNTASNSRNNAQQNQGVARQVLSAEKSINDEQSNQAIVDWESQQETLAGMKLQFTEMQSLFRPEHPEMARLKAEIEHLEGQLNSQAEIALKRFTAYFDALVLQEKGLERAISDWKNDQIVSVQLLNQHNQLLTKVELLKKKYDIVYQRLLENSEEGDLFFMRIIEPAFCNTIPFSPNRSKILMASIGAGVALGLGLIVLLELIRPQKLNFEYVENTFHIPFFTGIPEWEQIYKKSKFDPKRDKFICSQTKNSSATETYRAIRAKIEMQFNHGEPFVLAVTSFKSSDGKTFNCGNVALPFSWNEKKVLLVDGDLRKSSLTHHFFGERLEKGLSTWLNDNESSVGDLIVDIPDTNLKLLPGGAFDDKTPELLTEPVARRLFKRLKEEFDVIIVDTAPATMVVETAHLCRAADGTMFIAHEKSNKHEIKQLIRELSNVRVIGFCINHVMKSSGNVLDRYRSTQYGYGYGNGNYKYGYK